MPEKLVRLTEAQRALARVTTIPEVRVWDSKLGALDDFARAMHWPIPDLNSLIETRVFFQRRGGELVKAIPPGKGGRGRRGGKVHQLGASKIARSVADRWVSLTRLKEADIRRVVALRSEKNQTVTLGYFYGLATPPAPVVVPPDYPEGPFRAIVIDPPWPIEKIEAKRRDKERTSVDYSTQDLEGIGELPIASLAHDAGCHIYLWVTHHLLPAGLALFEKWGVRYECVLTWVKPTAQPLWWAYTTEHCLFGKIGSLAPLVRGTPVSFNAPQQRHSHKPDEFFELVRRVSPERRLTMYDDARAGFEPWGQTHAIA